MVTHTKKLKRRHSITLLPTTITLTRNLFKETWGLLCIVLCGMVACVGLVCTVPLFSQVASQVGIQEIVKQAPGAALTDVVISDHPTATQIQQAGHTLNQFLQANLGAYLGGSAQFSLSTPRLQLLDTQTNKALASQYVSVFGYDPSQFPRQFMVLQGRLPQANPVANEVEVAVTQPVADALALHVGTLQQVRYPVAAGSTVWHLHVVGIVSIRPSAGDIWHSGGVSTTETQSGVDVTNVTNDIVASLPAILPQVSAIQIVQEISGVGSIGQLPAITRTMPPAQTSTTSTVPMPAQKTTSRLLQFTSTNSGGPGPSTDPNPQFLLYWSYPFNLTHIDDSNLNSFLSKCSFIAGSLYNLIQDRHVLYQNMQQSATVINLNGYHSDILYEQIAVILLLISILGLALFMVSVLSNVLVERQLPAIVMLRSRGATLRHIFGSFTLQSLLIGLLALLLGPVCAIVLVGVVGQSLFTATDLSAFSTVASNLPHTIQQIWIFAVFTVLVAFIVMVVSLRRASLIDMVTLRQSASRQHRAPLWKRLYLDFFLLVIVALGVAYYEFLFQTGVGDRITLAPLAFLAVPALSFAIILLFLRIFPFLTRLGTRLAIKGKPAPSVLAFAQMERQPHATLRMILLLALALSSSIYLLTFIATQQYRVQQIVAYQTGADFSGAITVTNPKQTFKDLQAHYASLPGVLAATLGFHEQVAITGNTQSSAGVHNKIPITGNAQSYVPSTVVSAVDADTYAQTAVWSSSYTAQSLQSYTAQLASQRSAAIAHNEVYAIVTPDLWTALSLSPGKTFTLGTDDKYMQNIHFVALAEANYLPMIDPSDMNNAQMMIDYQTYAAVYAQAHQGTQVQPNSIWLHTRDDARSLSQVRQALPDLQDRRAMAVQTGSAPLPVAIEGTFILGLLVTFVLALIGVGVAAWLSVKQRRMGFAILSALGMSSSQIAQILLWEQGVTYLSALVIGLGVGWLSTLLISPAFSLMDRFFSSLGIPFSSIGFPLPKNVPLPFTWIGLMLGIFVIICGIVLLIMSRNGSRSATRQMLRLNED